MATDHRAKLASIKRFDQLIAYLRDEMGWPIAQDSFEDVEDLFYDFTADELGIDPKTAAKIESIKRLRPLSVHQPWGIFFVKFEPKKLPVVALRRILGQVALKKRPSANSAERTAWAAEDLLFISNYGEGSERQISFAHFAKPSDGHNLPTLKVLGWDNLDTALHLDAVAKELTEHLSWPVDDTDVESWRKEWRGAFTLRHGEVVTTSKQLSIRLAGLARDIRDRIKAALRFETERGPLTKLMKAFQTSLVHDLKPDDFADMYAQTIAYGLLSARIADPHKKTVDDFADHMRTNPFLRELMETFLKVGGRRGKAGGPGIDFDELGVNEVVELLDDANMEAVVRDFGDKNPQEDPVIHFYELFLKEYDAKKRMQRGVFYTPRPVVSFIVRSVDELLRAELGLEDGLADTTTWAELAQRIDGLKIPEGIAPDQAFVQIIDPATGTGTFLVEVIDTIHRTMVAKWKAQRNSADRIASLWNEWVPKHLLTRLHAYELLMAPYAIAHLKLGLKLHETGYDFSSDERARIYLTNGLEPASDKQLDLDLLPALAHEAQAVNRIKRGQRFTVVIGNPPYSNFGQLNKIPSILTLLDDYKRGLRERKINLDDDFIKFLRFAQSLLESSGAGVFGMITNNSYLDGVTHRQMRHCLGEAYSRIEVLNLHGSATLGEVTPDGLPDENVFDIRQGVAITVAARVPKAATLEPTLGYGDLWGTRSEKYTALSTLTLAKRFSHTLPLQPEYYFFVPKDFRAKDEYGQFFSLRDVLVENNTGIQTKRDSLTIHFTRDELRQALEDLSRLSDGELRTRYNLPPDGRDWQIAAARKDVGDAFDGRRISRLLYRPFDWRWTYFTGKTGGFLAYPRRETMLSMLRPNLAIVTLRINGGGSDFAVIVADCLVEKGSLPRGNYSVFPLYHYLGERAAPGRIGESEGRIPNLGEGFLRALAGVVGKSLGDLASRSAGFSPEDAFSYVYAILNAPSYRTRFGELLQIDFPRIPLPSSSALFWKLSALGCLLVEQHLLKTEPPTEFGFTYCGPKAPQVERVGWSDESVWLDAGAARNRQPAVPGTVGFRNVPEEVWNFHIAGYQVCEKWLKDRMGRTLTKDDLTHYRKILFAIGETVRLMKEIDEVIEQHGGWPGAFQESESKAAPAEVIPYRPRTVEPKPEERYVTCVPVLSLKVAAGAFGEGQPAFEGDEVEWIEVGGGRRLRAGMFVAQVVGKSMEPEIPDGAYCLFRAPVEGSRQGKTVLVELRDAADPETGERYTVKRYESEKVADGESWRHAAITLRPVNSEFEPIVLEAGAEERLRVVAEFLDVVQAQTAPGPDSSSESNSAEVREENQPAPPLQPARGRSRAAEAAMEMAPLFRESDDAPAARSIADVEDPEAMCAIRDLFESPAAREGIERDEAIRLIARDLGFARTGKNIADSIDSYLVAAARRGIVETRGGRIHLVARSIADYERDLVKDQFLASLGGYSWTEREEAVRAFARWLGYKRTGPVISDAARSVINGLIRQGRLESAGNRVRRVR